MQHNATESHIKLVKHVRKQCKFIFFLRKKVKFD